MLLRYNSAVVDLYKFAASRWIGLYSAMPLSVFPWTKIETSFAFLKKIGDPASVPNGAAGQGTMLAFTRKTLTNIC